jgi:hypothetical protein
MPENSNVCRAIRPGRSLSLSHSLCIQTLQRGKNKVTAGYFFRPVRQHNASLAIQMYSTRICTTVDRSKETGRQQQLGRVPSYVRGFELKDFSTCTEVSLLRRGVNTPGTGCGASCARVQVRRIRYIVYTVLETYAGKVHSALSIIPQCCTYSQNPKRRR